MVKLTIRQFAEKIGVTSDSCYGLMQFLKEKGLAVKVGEVEREAGKKGKGADIFEIDTQTSIDVMRRIFTHVENSST